MNLYTNALEKFPQELYIFFQKNVTFLLNHIELIC